MDLAFLHMNLIMNSGGVNPIHFKNPNISSRFVGKKTYFPIPGIPSRLAGNIHPGFDDFPTSTMPRCGRVPGHHQSSQGWPVCCLQQLQGLLPAADVDPGETSQRSTVSVESQSENHLTLGQNMSKWGTPIINLQATEKNRRKSMLSGVLFFTAIINGCGTMGMAWWLGRSSLGPPSAPWKLAARHGFYTMKSTGCSSHWAEDTLQLVTF